MIRARLLPFLLSLFILTVHASTDELDHWTHPFGLHIGQTSWQTLSAQFPDHDPFETAAEQLFHSIYFPMPNWQRYLISDIEFPPVADPVTLIILVDPEGIIQNFSLYIDGKNPHAHAQSLIAETLPSAPLNSLFDHSYPSRTLAQYGDQALVATLLLHNNKFKTNEGYLYLSRWVMGALETLPKGITLSQQGDISYSDQLPEDYLSLPWMEDNPNHGSSLVLVSPEYLRVFEESLRQKAEDPDIDDNVRTILREKLVEYGTP